MILAGSYPLTEAWGQNGFTGISPTPTEGCVDCLQTRADEILDCAYETDPLCQAKTPRSRFCSLEQLCKTRKSPSLAIRHDFGNGDIAVNSAIQMATLEIRECLLQKERTPKKVPTPELTPVTIEQDLLAIASCVEKGGDKASQEIGNFALCRDGVPLKDPGLNPTKPSDPSFDPRMAKTYECLEAHVKLCKSEYLKYLNTLAQSNKAPNNYSNTPKQEEASARILGLSLTGSSGHYTPLVKEEATEVMRRTMLARSAFEDAKNDSIAYLNSLRIRDSKSAYKYALMIERIQLLTLQFEIDPTVNAAYHTNNHYVRLNSATLLLPSDAIYGILLHEIGHATSGCATRRPIHKESKGNGPVPIRVNAMSETDLYSLLRSQSDEATHVTTTKENQNKDQMVSQAMPFKDHPFRSIKDCLSKRRAADIHVKGSDHRIRKLMELSAKKSPTDAIPALKQSKRLRNEVAEEVAACVDLRDGHASEAEESVADWFQTSVLDHSLKLKEQKRSLEGVASVEYAWCPITTKETETLKTLLQDLYNQTGCKDEQSIKMAKMTGNDPRSLTEQATDMISDGTGDPHAMTATRYDRILLASPRIRKALGCPARPLQKHCELK